MNKAFVTHLQNVPVEAAAFKARKCIMFKGFLSLIKSVYSVDAPPASGSVARVSNEVKT